MKRGKIMKIMKVNKKEKIRRISNMIVLGALVVGLHFITIACKSDQDPDDAFDSLIRQSSFFTQPAELVSPEATAPEMEVSDTVETGASNPADNNTYKCTTRAYRAAPGYNELFILNPTTDAIYPGVVLRGESIPTGEYRIISNRRKPLTISVSILGVQNQAAEMSVGNYSLSAFRTALIPLLNPENLEGLSPSANQVFSVSSIEAIEHFGVAIGLSIMAQATPTVSFGASANFSISETDETQKYIARYIQRYFTIDIDLPSDPSDLFEEFPEDVGVSPVYVSSTTYGRQVLLAVDSKRTELEIQAGVSASLSIENRLDFSASLDSDYQNTLNQSSFRGSVVGGPSHPSCAIPADLTQLGECLSEGGKYVQGQLLSYTLRFLRDNSVARVVLASSYTARQCNLTASAGADIRTYKVNSIKSSNNDDTPNKALELSGQIWITPTSDAVGVGSARKCELSEQSSTQELYRVNANMPDNNKLIFNIPGSIRVGGSDIGLQTRNFQATADFPNSTPNLSLCGIFRERDGALNSDDLFSYRTVISSNIEMGQTELIRFDEGGKGVVKINL